jgi:RNA-splicing ligase RtcB
LEVEGYYTQLAQKSGDSAFAALKGEAFADYLHDMRITQKFAHLNRQAISGEIAYAFKWNIGNFTECFETIHNYIDIENMIVRKGAISLAARERAIIPMNMADGSLIVRGKGNDDWNQSGPHGAGRLMSRGQARRTLSMDDFKASMAGIYSTTVCKDTIDESKMAYKPMQSIIDAITDTADIVDTIKPIYNFKAAEKRRK